MSIDVIMTIESHTDTLDAIRDSAARVGIKSSIRWQGDGAPFFIDFPFTDPDADFGDHLATVRENEPELTVAPDVERGRDLDEVIKQADKLLAHADDVIIVPKDCHPSEIPDRFRVGLTLANYGSSAPWTLWAYRDCESIHLLGGSPGRQMTVIEHGLSVDSMDSYTLGMRCRYGMWDSGAVDAPEGWEYKKRLRESLDNYIDTVTDMAAR